MAKDFFERPEYAERLARQLLEPREMELGVRSGVFLSNIRRVGKTTFLKRELIPALLSRGAVVIYVDLWADTTKAPATLVNDAVRAALRQLQVPGSGLGKRLKALNFGALGVTFGFQVDALGEPGGATLAEALRELVERTRTDVVLIIDEVQQAASTDSAVLMHALKAARDAVNSDPEAPGRFLFVGTGSHRSLVNDMATLPSHPFKGAVTASFERLPQAFVRWKLARWRADGASQLPSDEAAWSGFQTVGQRPEELDRALVNFQALPQPTDSEFRAICLTLASAAVDVELARASDLCGVLGEAVFDRIAAGPKEGTKEIYSSAALGIYTEITGTAVDAKQVQNVVDKLIAANLIARVGHGKFIVSDPFVQQVWRERRVYGLAFDEAAGASRPSQAVN